MGRSAPDLRSIALAVLAVLACGPVAPGARAPSPDRGAPGGSRPAPAAPVPVAAPPPEPAAEVDWLPRVESMAAWRRLAAPSDEHAAAVTEVVKFLLDGTDDTLYLCQSRRWPLHWEFARRFAHRPEHPVAERDVFGVAEYRTARRRFVLGSLVHYVDPDVWTMELRPGDNLDAPGVRAAFERIRAAVFFGDRLRYMPRSDLHEQSIAVLRPRLPTVAPGEVLSAVRYQPLTAGVAFGTLRRFAGAVPAEALAPTDVVVAAGVPDDLPVVAALVTGASQAPLSHLAVLCHGRATPNMALRGALDDPRLRALEGALVRLEVGPRAWSVRRARPEEAREAWRAIRPAPVSVGPVDASRHELVALSEVRLDDAAVAGAKAAQLGEVGAIRPPLVTPGGFVIPFAWSIDHAHLAGLDARLAALSRAEPATRERGLAELRAAIEGAEVDPALLRELVGRVGAPVRRDVILRSSTNAEDLAGFSGAGLYESEVVRAGAGVEEVARALRVVWASLWTRRGFEERSWYGIAQERVAMAVLVQPFLPAAAIGVAITANPYSDWRGGDLVNVQALGGSVTAAGDEVPEQLLAFPRAEPEILSRSSRTGGRPILSRDDVARLEAVLRRLDEHFRRRWGGSSVLDVEFLVPPRGGVVVLQVRPYRPPRAGRSR